MKNDLATAVVLASLCSLLGTAAPASAMDAMSGAPDCSKASMMMQTGMMPSTGMMANDHMSDDHMMASPDPSQGVDASYLKAQMEMLKHQSMMAKMEMACGKNADAKAQAKKLADSTALSENEVQTLLHQVGL